MSASFASRRKARAIGQDVDGGAEDGEMGSGSAVKRPVKPKHRPRISFGPGGTAMAEEDGEGSVVTPKRGLARRTLERNAAQVLITPEMVSDGQDDSLQDGDQRQPNYSKEYLSELKSAQSSRPESDSIGSASRNTELATKFGTEISTFVQGNRSTYIPTDIEIQEKKARRARLAKLAKHNIDPEISGDDDPRDDRPGSDEDEFLTHRDKILLRDERTINKKEVDTRLLRDDEDLMEGFKDFTGESTRLALGSNTQDKVKARQRAEMQDLIHEAQEQDLEDDSDSEAERREEYESLQTRKGIDGLHISGDRKIQDEVGARTPPKLTPIPTLEECIQRLRGKLLDMEENRKVKLSRLEDLQTEKRETIEREVEIQRLLTEKASEYERMSAGAGGGQKLLNVQRSSELASGRGLEDLGTQGVSPLGT